MGRRATVLTAFGFEDLAPSEPGVGGGAPDPGEVARARQWIKTHCRRSRLGWAELSSYGLKHVCERAMGRYVSNGAFILAAQELGVRVERIDTGPNALVGLTLPRKRTGARLAAGFMF